MAKAKKKEAKKKETPKKKKAKLKVGDKVKGLGTYVGDGFYIKK